MKYEIYHHGILGQKWGRRRFRNEDGTLTAAGKERYSSEQYKRDKSVYGLTGANRIQRNVNKKGDSVSAARSKEARRIGTARKSATVASRVGSIAGSAAGGIGAYLLTNKLLGSKIGDPNIAQIVSIGAATAATTIGGLLGKVSMRDATMLASGYNPNRYRAQY